MPSSIIVTSAGERCPIRSQGPTLMRLPTVKNMLVVPAYTCLEPERQQVHRQWRATGMGDHRRHARCAAGQQRGGRRSRSDRDAGAASQPRGGKHQGDKRHHDFDRVAVEIPEHEEADADAGQKARQQYQEVRLRPCRRLPVAEREDVHHHEQRGEHRARLDRVHHQSQQRNADDCKAAAESALHEADHEDAGRGDAKCQRINRHGKCPYRYRHPSHGFSACNQTIALRAISLAV